MLKVGILTKHCVPNYGAMLQAYALRAKVEALGHRAELVDYYAPATTDYYSAKLTFPPRVRHMLRIKRCANFVKDLQVVSDFRCTSVEELKPHLSGYDALITGSDQVWFTGPVQYFDPVFFMEFPFSGTKISYAPSVGGIDSFEPFEDRAKAAINDIGNLSVRDENSVRVVSDLTGRTPEVVCDPTFLHGFQEITDSKRPLDAKYLLIFGDIPGRQMAAIAEAAKKRGITEIVSLQYPSASATRRIASPSPTDWLRWFAHSDFVVTSYFHGSVFAAKFRKPFISIPTAGRVKKVRSLLSDLGLEECFVDRDGEGETIQRLVEGPVDWGSVGERQDALVAKASGFLQGALQPEPAIA